jgi:hypothetical protein
LLTPRGLIAAEQVFVDPRIRHGDAYNGEVSKRDRQRQRQRLTFGDLVDSFGPLVIGVGLIAVLILAAWSCHGSGSY